MSRDSVPARRRSIMPYRRVEIEVVNELAGITLSDSEAGIAVVLRRNGKPIAFWMDALSPGSSLSPEDVARRIAAEAADKLLQEQIRDELGPAAAPSRAPAVTVAICTKDRTANLARCIDSVQSLLSSDARSSRHVELLVVDNAPSDDQTRRLVELKPGVHYCREPRAGLDFARNRALREASTELIAFIDDDVVVDRSWLEGLMDAYSEHPDAAAFTGLVLPFELETTAQIMFERHGGFRRGFDTIRYQGDTLPGNPLYPCGAGIFGAGANMAFRRDVLLRLGGFDEALDTGRPLPGGGDLDIFYRVIRAGYPLVYEPRFLAYHEHRRGLRELRRQYWSWGLGFMAFVEKTYRTDSDYRVRIRRLVTWWFQYQLRQLLQSLRGLHPLTSDMILAELWGGIRGILGEYARSRKRVERIKKGVNSRSHRIERALQRRTAPPVPSDR